MTDNQGKTPKQQKDSSIFTIIGYVGLVLVIVITMLFIGDYTGFNDDMGEKIKNDPRPANRSLNYIHPSLLVDTLTPQDSLEMKEPSTIYYDTTGSPCVDGVSDSVPYLDEDVMWIGGDGDTIWE